MTTDTSAEAVRCALLRMSMAGEKADCEIVGAAYSALAAKLDTILDTHTDKADAWDVMAKKNETIATLRIQLAEARNAALDEVVAAISNIHPMHFEDAILSLKTTGEDT